MRNLLFAIALALLSASSASAEPSSHQKPDKSTPSGKQLPLKGAGHGNSCAMYGEGFVRLEGSETCVKIGGAVSIGAGTSLGR
jgi:hypothetical protein